MGGDSTTTSASGRVVLGIWWICTILLLQLYTANLAAYLTIPPAKSPIKNIEQLAASSEYKPLVKTGSNLDFLFKVVISLGSIVSYMYLHNLVGFLVLGLMDFFSITF